MFSTKNTTFLDYITERVDITLPTVLGQKSITRSKLGQELLNLCTANRYYNSDRTCSETKFTTDILILRLFTLLNYKELLVKQEHVLVTFFQLTVMKYEI